MAVGGGDDFYILHKEPQYPLPFKVEGYFDLVGCELVNGSGVYHDHPWISIEPDNQEQRLPR